MNNLAYVPSNHPGSMAGRVEKWNCGSGCNRRILRTEVGKESSAKRPSGAVSAIGALLLDAAADYLVGEHKPGLACPDGPAAM